MKTVLVIGGGASGMMAALSAAENGNNRVIIAERQARVGRKLLATGNGRCNLTNTGAVPECYHGENPEFAVYALKKYTPEKTLEYFRSLGLVSVVQYGGRVYPLSDSANSVLDVLRFAIEEKSIEVRTGVQIKQIGRKNGKLFAVSDESVIECDKIIVACGGKAGGKLGGVGDGYNLLKQVGHHITALYPALVPVETDSDYPRSLKGIRADAAVSVGSLRREGEVQFTEKGVSGPAVFDLSREASLYGGELKIDFVRELDVNELETLLEQKPKNMEVQLIYTGILQSRIGTVLSKYCGYRPSELIENVSVRKMAEAAKDFRMRIKGVGSFDNAQITVGGARTDEFNPETMESRLCPGVFACGEVLDIDADCGGFNLQWAWASGRLAGNDNP